MMTLSSFYQSVFSCKVYKLSLDAGCTCPNRDGTKGWGGCIFCSESGSGDFAASRGLSIHQQVEEAKARVESKLKGRGGNRQGKYIAYFQNFTSTYGDENILEEKYKEALSCPDVVGLAIATRPDCLSPGILSKIGEISKNHFVQIELGLQTSNENTGRLINRCYTDEDYADAVNRIRKTNPAIHIVTHLIFGLPGETEEDMMKSVDFVKAVNPEEFGLKITVLYVLEGTKLADLYSRGDFAALSQEDYFALLEKALCRLGPRCILHRLTGDPPKKTLLAPLWTKDKKRVLNQINTLLQNFQ